MYYCSNLADFMIKYAHENTRQAVHTMIFYFSGTGNSEHAARALLQENEQLISIANAANSETFTFSPAEGENVGFVFPVYFYGLPDTVRRFVKKTKYSGYAQTG